MLRKILTLVIVITFVIYVVADEGLGGDKSDDKTEITPRRRKHLYHALFPLVGLGGLHAISAFVAIKLKLVIVFILIVATAFFGFKIWTGASLFGCKNHGPQEIEGAIVPYEHGPFVSHSGPGISYNGPDPYSAWNPDTLSTAPSSSDHFHHDFSHDFHHDFHHDASPHDVSHDHSHDTTAASGASAPDVTSKRRVAYQNSGGRSARQNSFDWTSMAFAVLGVDTMVCRKRFVCEMEVQSKDNPFFGFAYNYLSQGMLTEYRNFPEIPHNLADCARLFKECYSPADKAQENSSSAPEEESQDEDIATSTDDADTSGRQIMTMLRMKTA
ncbi:uncharacterized protein LOC132259144 [Phlebotomus argentipes]|uniref:uncharacterized protein LOC132259144 n=1 Tax=Phlebotomus argentipes TaxID=94469 RepID=UPI002892DE76|nr:uncharacterized protein LOC132259144 [Phlebotomus argentipes]